MKTTKNENPRNAAERPSATSSPTPGDRAGEVLGGKYTLLRLIGRGGMGAVYEAVHRNGRHVAVKLLIPELAKHPDVLKRFLREGYAANAVDHPRVVQVLDDDTTSDGSVFIVMELLRGESLAERASRLGGRLPESFALTAARDLLDTLAAAHARSVIHRDIKPDNLFWMEGFGLKVLDFGIARIKLAQVHSMGTQQGMVLGTPGFMAPEQALGDIEAIDARTDLWAVAASLFTLLSGQLVHDAPTLDVILARTATMRAVPLASIAPWVSPATCEIVDRGLAIAQGERWPSAERMRDAVHASLERLPLDAAAFAPTTMATRSVAEGIPSVLASSTTLVHSRPPRRTRVPVVTITLLMTVAAIGGGLYAAKRSETPSSVVAAASPAATTPSEADRPSAPGAPPLTATAEPPAPAPAPAPPPAPPPATAAARSPVPRAAPPPPRATTRAATSPIAARPSPAAPATPPPSPSPSPARATDPFERP